MINPTLHAKAVYVALIERGPGKKEYDGVTAKLFAKAVKESME